MLLDTSGLLCYFDESESRHQDAVTFFDLAPTKMTHSYVLAEFVALCQVRVLRRRDALTFLAYLTDNPLVEVIWVDESLHRVAQAYLGARLDKRRFTTSCRKTDAPSFHWHSYLAWFVQ